MVWEVCGWCRRWSRSYSFSHQNHYSWKAVKRGVTWEKKSVSDLVTSSLWSHVGFVTSTHGVTLVIIVVQTISVLLWRNRNSDLMTIYVFTICYRTRRSHICWIIHWWIWLGVHLLHGQKGVKHGEGSRVWKGSGEWDEGRLICAGECHLESPKCAFFSLYFVFIFSNFILQQVISP